MTAIRSARTIVATVVALAALLYIALWIGYFRHNSSTRQELQNLTEPLKVAEACRLMMLSLGTNAFGNVTGDDPSVPVMLRDLRARHLIFQQHELRLEFHGGSDHYGLVFAPIDVECPTGRWSLAYYDGLKRQSLASIEWSSGK